MQLDRRRRLLRDDAPVAIGPKAYDVPAAPVLGWYRQLGDRLGTLWPLMLAVRCLGPNRIPMLRDFIARCRRSGAFRLGAMAHANLSHALLIAGDLHGAREVAQALLQEGWPPLPRPFAVTEGNGASALVLVGEYEAAAAEYRSALRQLPNLTIMHWVLYFMAYAAARQGRVHDAARIHGFVRDFAQWLGVVVRGVEAWADAQTDALLREALDRLHAEGASFTPAEVLALAGLESRATPLSEPCAG